MRIPEIGHEGWLVFLQYLQLPGAIAENSPNIDFFRLLEPGVPVDIREVARSFTCQIVPGKFEHPGAVTH